MSKDYQDTKVKFDKITADLNEKTKLLSEVEERLKEIQLREKDEKVKSELAIKEYQAKTQRNKEEEEESRKKRDELFKSMK